MSKVSISFGAMAPHVGEQEPRMRAGLAIQVEKYRQAVNLLRINEILTPSEAKKVEQRMFKIIVGDVKRGMT